MRRTLRVAAKRRHPIRHWRSVTSQKKGILKARNLLRCVGKNYFYKFHTDRSKVKNK